MSGLRLCIFWNRKFLSSSHKGPWSTKWISSSIHTVQVQSSSWIHLHLLSRSRTIPVTFGSGRKHSPVGNLCTTTWTLHGSLLVTMCCWSIALKLADSSRHQEDQRLIISPLCSTGHGTRPRTGVNRCQADSGQRPPGELFLLQMNQANPG